MSKETQETTGQTPLNEVFAAARKEKGLSLETVSSRLNLTVARIEKLESSEFDPASLTTFERGYVRNYATMLDIEPSVYDGYFPESDTVCSELHSVQRYSTPVPKTFFSRQWVKRFTLLIAVAIVVILVWINLPDFMNEQDNQRLSPPTLNESDPTKVQQTLDLPKPSH